MEAYQWYLGQHAVTTAVVYAVGRAMQRGIGAESEARRVHGRYVFWWAVGAHAVGGPVSPLAGADGPNGSAGFAMFCLLGGWLVGMLHGAVALATRRPVTAGRGPGTDPTARPAGRGRLEARAAAGCDAPRRPAWARREAEQGAAPDRGGLTAPSVSWFCWPPRQVSWVVRRRRCPVDSPYAELWVETPDGQSMCALINGDRGRLVYLRENGDSGFSSRNPGYDGPAGAEIEYRLNNGQHDLYPASWALPVETLHRALEYFERERRRPPFIEWHEG